ncbi:PKD repeat protein [Aquimarina sp. EL_43]|uniref:PKD domain-containing protein n=1 Tax=unclassified Aquimarina TaxID=2627091 RepID=UPI0018C92A1E|nr:MULTISPECIES: PKD domain-containing protein [unclassified Aquimarina]MBG6133051.1 PKD repeat protein [Aquimarina sp. EL_35]MBG6152362.1 PKD repeat protein [Aquimarina sp. EL_32]MBG6171200.1 PKD repeat protein [Aquimarina sp. EL_43]
MRGYILYCTVLFPLLCIGQILTNDTIPRIAPISYEINGNQVVYGAEMPPLNQIAGAPKAFYTYYWEFGDGNYSFKEKPAHRYTSSGTYEAKLWATNNYDNGKPPTSRPKSITVSDASDEASIGPNSPFIEDDDLILKRNREPIPDQEMIFITSYKNTNNYISNGKLYLFYNDNQFKNDNFILEDTRLHHEEKIIPLPIISETLSQNDDHTLLASSTHTTLQNRTLFVQDTTKRKNLPLTLEESKSLYRNYQVIAFNDMQPGEERNIFRTLKTTPEMIKDTSAIVTLRSIYVPDENFDNHTVKDTEMEIVTSHDPNKMSSNGWLMNYRLVRFKRLKFKVRFQNNGEGPANTIKLAVDTPEMFDKATLKIDGMYPECPICPKEREVNYSCLDTILKKDKIIFQFNRIYLPGSQQKNVTEIDSTKGFVKYSMKFGKDFHKKKTKSRTAIYFDKNEPIITNYATTRFMPGISIGAKAGYIMVPELDNQKEYFVGATLSPFKSYRGYYQAELMASASSYDELRNFETTSIDANGTESLIQFSEANTYNNISIYAVPGSFRYNFNNFFAMGAGIQLKMDITSKNDQETIGEGFTIIRNNGPTPPEIIRNIELDVTETQEIKDDFTNIQTGIFVGMNFGTVRIGPSIGVRYVHNFDSPNSQIQFYGIWKF